MFEQTLSADAQSNLAAVGQTSLAQDFYLYRGTQIASIADLAAMKVDAITRRGRKRDFIDLFTICKQSIPLGQALDLYFRKFANFNISQVHVLKSLVYFGDAETDEMPNLLQPVGWKAVKTFFEKEVGQLYRSKTVRINKS